MRAARLVSRRRAARAPHSLAAPAAPSRGAHGGPSSSLAVQAGLNSSMPFSLDRKTKIVCTIGPASVGRLDEMLYAGMNVARINCAHGDAAQYAEIVAAVRAAEARVRGAAAAAAAARARPPPPGTPPHALASVPLAGSRHDVAAIAFDVKGPEIRTGRFGPGVPPTLIAGKPGPKEVPLARGSVVTLTTAEATRDAGTPSSLFVSYPALVRKARPGQLVYVDDGNVELEVTAVDAAAGTLTCVSNTAAPLGERKNVNLPGIEVDLPAVTAKDRVDIATARALSADFIFASFVQSAAAVREIRALAGPSIAIISKIESQAGVDRIDEIISASDGIMVARGDLGVQIPGERVFLAQKMMIARANIRGKVAICATQMLDSMINSPRPTRAEIVDVASAVLDGADAVMLSGETAKGKYPLEAVTIMSKTCQAAEAAYTSRAFFTALCDDPATPVHADADEALLYHETEGVRAWLAGRGHEGGGPADDAAAAGAAAAAGDAAEDAGSASFLTIGDAESLASSAVHAAFETGAKAIVVFCSSGRTAGLVCKYRPRCPVLCVTSDDATARALQVRRGAQVLFVPPGLPTAALRAEAAAAAARLGVGAKGDRLVVVQGSSTSVSLMTMT